MKHATTKQNYHHIIADELSHILADTYTLYLKTQNFHWNVTGMHFHSLHLMFEGQYKELADAIDEIAERIRALGTYAPAAFSSYLKLASLKEETKVLPAETMIKHLLHDHEILVHHINTVIVKAQNAKDEATADLLIERLAAHEKTAWMLSSTLKSVK